MYTDTPDHGAVPPQTFADRVRGLGRRRTAVVVAALVAFSGAGVAIAAWTSTGTGPATAKAMTVVVTTVTTDSSQPADLYPGGPAGTLYFKIDNPNPTAATFHSMTPGAVTVDGGHSACDPALYITVASKTGLTINVPANTAPASAVPRSVASAVTMSTSAPDACQGAVFSVQVTLNGNLA